MAATLVLAVLALLGLVIIFVVAYLIKGWKVALIATGSAFVVFAALYVIIIYVISNSM